MAHLLQSAAWSREAALAIPPTVRLSGAHPEPMVGGYYVGDDLPQLRGRYGRAEYRDMARDGGIISATLDAMRMLIKSVRWSVEFNNPGVSDESTRTLEQTLSNRYSQGDQFFKWFLETVLFDDMLNSWDDFVEDAFSFLIYGWSYFEMTLKRRDPTDGSQFSDGWFGIRDMAYVPQLTLDRWELSDVDGSVLGIWHTGAKGDLVGSYNLPIERCVHFIGERDNNSPEGRSMLRRCYYSWKAWREMEELTNLGFQTAVQGTPLFRVPKNVMNPKTQEDQRNNDFITGFLKNYRRLKESGLMLPSETYETQDKEYTNIRKFDFELIQGNAEGAMLAAGQNRSQYLEMTMAGYLLADFLSLRGAQNTTGSYAMSQSKRDFFELGIRGRLQSFASTVNKQMIPKLWKANGFPMEYMPTIKPGKVREYDIELLASILQRFAAAGMTVFPDARTETHVREILSLPPTPTQEERMYAMQQDPAFLGTAFAEMNELLGEVGAAESREKESEKKKRKGKK